MEASSANRPRFWRLQFSLRLLLVAFTAFAIGFPVWYRWPYHETVVNRFPTGPVSAPTGTDQSTRVTTWQRQWGGGKLKHGPEKSYFHNCVFTTPYVNGKRNGVYTFFDGKELRETGKFLDDWKEGVWFEQSFGDVVTTTWHQDELEGPCEWKWENGEKTSAVFRGGRLIAFNGQPFDDHLFDLLAANALDEATASALVDFLNGGYVGIPLKDFIEMVTMMHPMRIIIDSKTVPPGDYPITGSSNHMGLATVLTLRLAPHSLVCDYRYGCVWITTAKDAKGWHDRSGASEIHPQAGTDLAQAWNKPAVAAVTTSPLAEVLATIARPLGIEINTSKVAPTADDPNAFPTVTNTNGVPFRHALGILLYETGCRCKLEGDTLMIWPPE